jgi:uncharacterized protein with NAD-binding domain and iron-sulfur cluster
MNAGMGDTIFAPAYQALINRGVQVEFFHRVTNLHLSEDKKSIASIDFDVQATTKKGGPYYPLHNIKTKKGDLPVWPKHPLYDQLVEGEELKKRDINLDSFWTPWHGKTKTLHAGKDFDQVVFGISMASIPFLCEELIDHSSAWRKMVDNVGTVRTQAIQLWLKPTTKELSGSAQSPIIDAWIPPLNTWADMTILLEEESWPGPQPGSLAYFCGPMEGGIPDPKDPKIPQAELNKVEHVADKMQSTYINTLWKNLASNGLPSGDVMLRFCRANIDPSERYVMSLAGSAAYRLRADQSGFENLVITGDWIRNGYNAGCIEASTWSGIQAANTILGRPLNEGVIS